MNDTVEEMLDGLFNMEAWRMVQQELHSFSPALSAAWPLAKDQIVRSKAESIQENSYKMIHTGPWSEVLPVWRRVYQGSCLLLGLLGLLQCRSNIQQAMFHLDMGLIFGDDTFRPHIHGLIDAIIPANMLEVDPGKEVFVSSEQLACAHANTVNEYESGIQSVSYDTLSLESFLLQYAVRHKPVVIRGLANTWPACALWNYPKYWKEQISLYRTVPVEIGECYMHDDWTQKCMSFEEFIDHILTQESVSSHRMYLAQHQIFIQIPRLGQDVYVPYYIYAMGASDNDIQKSIWIGPKGTWTPLHSDPYHNIFVQVVGLKHVRLYSPNAGPHLDLDTDPLTSNTSKMSRAAEVARFKALQRDPAHLVMECVLGPADALYIPQGWFHSVESHTASISVSFWWSSRSTQ